METTTQLNARLLKIEQAEDALLSAQHAYLRAAGWHYTCANAPGSLWLWQRQLPGPRPAHYTANSGVTVLQCTTATALTIQRTMQE